MINMGLSAKQEKDNRFQQIKKEVVEMIKERVPSLESKVCFAQFSPPLSLPQLGFLVLFRCYALLAGESKVTHS